MLGSVALGATIAIALPGAAGEEAALLARAELQGGESAGTVFFVETSAPPGAVAIGASHTFDPTRLAESGQLRFRAGSGEVAATSKRYYTRPGPAFYERGATLRDAFVAFSLAAAPQGVRILEPVSRTLAPGDRTRVLGLNRDGAQTAVFGTVVRAERDRIEIDLDAWADLRGWGGAPVFAVDGEEVVGLLQSAWPADGKLRVGAGPIEGVAEGLAAPLDRGIGRLFATLAPTPSAANSPAARRRVATGSARGYLPPERNARLVAAARSASQTRSAASRTLRLAIEHPPPGSVVGDQGGVFLVGRAQAPPAAARRFDIVIVIDTSDSTNQPAGVDVDGDQSVGEAIPDERRGLTEPASTDPGDSILAAEVAAARRLLEGLDPRMTRVGLVTFAGQALLFGNERAPRLQVKKAALAHEPLTSDYRRLERALDRIAARGGKGMTFMAAGIDQASLELLGLAGSLSGTDRDSEKVILFFTDGQPTLPNVHSEAENVRAVMGAAQRARGAGIRIYAFAIGPEALEGPVAAVEMAEISGGSFVPVRHPEKLARFVERESFAHIESVEVQNTTTGERAYHVRVHPDGSWDALVPLHEGQNRVEVRARSGNGLTATEAITVSHRGGAPSPLVPVEWVPKYNRQLELRLADLRAENLEALRKELTLEVEREREAAQRRAARQRKELELEVEGTP